jgi:hypothetical protein
MATSTIHNEVGLLWTDAIYQYINWVGRDASQLCKHEYGGVLANVKSE